MTKWILWRFRPSRESYNIDDEDKEFWLVHEQSDGSCESHRWKINLINCGNIFQNPTKEQSNVFHLHCGVKRYIKTNNATANGMSLSHESRIDMDESL